MVTPVQPRLTEYTICQYISPTDEPYRIMTDAQAWHLLESKFGMLCQDGRFYFPNQEKPIATSMTNLRNDLCAYGLPPSSNDLSDDDNVNIARWVRYAHVAGLVDGQLICPDDFGQPIKNNTDVMNILGKFGCRCSNGLYKIPGEKWTLSHLGVTRLFARFGIQCIPDDTPIDKLSRKDRFSLDVCFATPSSSDLNTFERIWRREDGTTNYVLPRTRQGRVK
mmetsp:Transcript_13116/g.31901  ORF Transcript_13116/g.31901 Transcript_13116/m.31901 type:complete len:222 (+) Transcript_13116:455-1120(+)